MVKKLLSLIVLNLTLLIGLALFLPSVSFAVVCNGVESKLNLCYPTFEIGGTTYSLNNLTPGRELSEIIAWFYYFIVIISGFAAFAMLVFGGFKYLSSAGNPTAISDAKDIIQKALLGLLLILISYLILQVINPDLILLREPLAQ